MTIWLTFWQFDWHFDNLIDILTIWLTFCQFDWYFANLIDILPIWLTFWQFDWHFDNFIDILTIYISNLKWSVTQSISEHWTIWIKEMPARLKTFFICIFRLVGWGQLKGNLLTVAYAGELENKLFEYFFTHPPSAVGWCWKREVDPPKLYQLFLCSFWSTIWENTWVFEIWVIFEVFTIFYTSSSF